jgi:hypothetical protein
MDRQIVAKSALSALVLAGVFALAFMRELPAEEAVAAAWKVLGLWMAATTALRFAPAAGKAAPDA